MSNPGGDVLRVSLHPRLSVANSKQPRDAGQRRIGVFSPKLNFLVIERRVVVSSRRLNTVVLRGIGLDDDLSTQRSSTGAAGHLSQQLKRTLGGPKIG